MSTDWSSWPGLLQTYQGEGLTHLKISLGRFICSSCFFPANRKSWAGRASWLGAGVRRGGSFIALGQDSPPHKRKCLGYLRESACCPHCLEKGKVQNSGFESSLCHKVTVSLRLFLPPPLGLRSHPWSIEVEYTSIVLRDILELLRFASPQNSDPGLAHCFTCENFQRTWEVKADKYLGYFGSQY